MWALSIVSLTLSSVIVFLYVRMEKLQEKINERVEKGIELQQKTIIAVSNMGSALRAQAAAMQRPIILQSGRGIEK